MRRLIILLLAIPIFFTGCTYAHTSSVQPISSKMLSQIEAKVLLENKGLKTDNLIALYDENGKFLNKKTEDKSTLHPTYQAYIDVDDFSWLIVITSDTIIANPLTYNSDFNNKHLIISEDKDILGYCSKNGFYKSCDNIYDIKQVEEINIDTLSKLSKQLKD